MRALVVLAVLGAAVAHPIIPDAPDVAAEKARFFHTFKAIEAAALPKGPSYMPAYTPQQAYVARPAPQPKWYGPLASQVPASLPGSSSIVADTADVQAARSSFFNAYKAQVAATVPKNPYYSAFTPSYAPARPQPKWTGPLASQVPASLPGSAPVVADTADVQAAKAAFYNSYARQLKATVPIRY